MAQQDFEIKNEKRRVAEFAVERIALQSISGYRVPSRSLRSGSGFHKLYTGTGVD
jgi:hypothetical protein